MLKGRRKIVNERKRKTIFIIEIILLVFLIIKDIQYISINFTQCTQSTNGRIVKTEETLSGSMKFYPVYQINVNGKLYKHTRLFSSDRKEWREGDIVEIKYNPQNPSQMYTIEEIESHNIRAISNIIGTILLACLMFVPLIIGRFF